MRMRPALLVALCTIPIAASPAPAQQHPPVPVSQIQRAVPGTIFRIWPLGGGVQPGYKGYRILYRTTGLDGAAVAATGAVMFPAAPPSAGHNDIVAWAHPTTGIAERCAPTLLSDTAGRVQGIDELTDNGYVIVAPDYIGLGSEGPPHPYLIGAAAAYSVLDSVRAVQTLKDAHASNRFVVWGHSQGGHAALFTGALAHSYAPELQILGVAAAAPATDLVTLFGDDKDKEKGLIAMALASWARVFGLKIEDFIEASAIPQFKRVAGDCIETLDDLFTEDADEKKLPKNYFKADPLKDAAVLRIMTENSAGGLPAGLPVFLSQGTADDVVNPSVTRRYMGELCKAGSAVKLVVLSGGGHVFAARDSAVQAVQWMSDRFGKRRAPSNC